jgi:hypothetical protein
MNREMKLLKLVQTDLRVINTREVAAFRWSFVLDAGVEDVRRETHGAAALTCRLAGEGR